MGSTDTINTVNTEISITISGHTLYFSYHYHTVVSDKLQGTKTMTFEHNNVLRFPAGLSADKDGNVYVKGN